MTISAPASPKTNPSRSLSNGRDAPSGSSLLVDMRPHHRERRDRQRLDVAFHAAADGDVRVTHDDLAPRVGDGLEPDEQADTGVMTPARAPSWRPTTAAAPLGMII